MGVATSTRMEDKLEDEEDVHSQDDHTGAPDHHQLLPLIFFLRLTWLVVVEAECL